MYYFLQKFLLKICQTEKINLKKTLNFEKECKSATVVKTLN